MIARYTRPEMAGIWTEKNRFEVMLDGTSLFSATDRTLPQPGPMGVWSQADSLTYYGSLLVNPPSR